MVSFGESQAPNRTTQTILSKTPYPPIYIRRMTGYEPNAAITAGRNALSFISIEVSGGEVKVKHTQ